MSQAWNKNTQHVTHDNCNCDSNSDSEQQHDDSRAIQTVSQAWNKNTLYSPARNTRQL